MLVIINVPKTVTRGMRWKVRTFSDSNKGHEFLNKGSNSLAWDIVNPDNNPQGYPIKRGTYAYAGQAYHNVRSIDPSALAHM
jgi:hypothetical protein